MTTKTTSTTKPTTSSTDDTSAQQTGTKGAGERGRSGVRQRAARVTTVDAHGVTHLSLPSGDIAYWVRCGVEL